MEINIMNFEKECESFENEMKKLYPIYYRLSEEQKCIVSDIASRLPISCESVATIFLIYGKSDRKTTMDYIRNEYGFVMD